MKNLHVLPTDKPSKLFKDDFGKYFISINIDQEQNHFKPQHLYITSDEEIKEGDWFIRDGSIHKCFRVHKTDIEFLTSIDSVYCGSNTFWSKEYCKKIILTTDQDLIKDGVQPIDDEFLEWFVKNPSCEWVEVRYCNPLSFVKGKPYTAYNYKIIIPQEEPKQETIKEAVREYVIYNFDSSLLDIDDHEEKVIAFAKWMHDYKADINKVYELFKQFKKK